MVRRLNERTNVCLVNWCTVAVALNDSNLLIRPSGLLVLQLKDSSGRSSDPVSHLVSTLPYLILSLIHTLTHYTD